MKQFQLFSNDWQRTYIICIAIILSPVPTCGLSAQENTTRAVKTSQTESSPIKSTSNAAAPSELRYVQVEKANVFAGPSEDFYPTCQLTRGDTVEVFQRTEDGWLAIRPPRGSFSWLPAAHGFLLPGGRVVEVTESSAVSWIGSTMGTAKQYRWQVSLRRGEQLAILGEQSFSDQSEKRTLWYKIAPPNGEFRWLQNKATSAEQPTVDSNVVQASAETILESDRGMPGILVLEPAADSRSSHPSASQHDRARPLPNTGHGVSADQWTDWHAIEYKNGSFSFPGISRMFGMTPQPNAAANSDYDPFDLAAAPTRTGSGAKISRDSATTTLDQSKPNSPVKRWRDPRALREMRQRSDQAVSDNQQTSDQNNSPFQSAIARFNQPTADAGNEAVGTSVVTAGANMPIGQTSAPNGSTFDNVDASARVDDATWYGIHQAPQRAQTSQPQSAIALHADISEVRLRLSEMVAGPEQTWNLAPLGDRTRFLIEHGESQIERGEARLLLDRIQGFADVAERSVQLGMIPPSSNQSAAPSNPANILSESVSKWASPLGLMNNQGELAPSSATKFDATGWIVPVHSNGRDMPTHALTDDSGKIIVYLSPAPGVNLARYQSQAIGVFGLRGYLPQLKSNHIQVQRAVKLQ